MTPNQLHIVQHALGCDLFGRTTYKGRDEGDGCFEFHRNRYVADSDADLCALLAQGLLQDHGAVACYGGMHCYTVTREGVAAMRRESPAPPRVSRAARRYEAFLAADSGLSFRDWLKAKHKAEVAR